MAVPSAYPESSATVGAVSGGGSGSDDGNGVILDDILGDETEVQGPEWEGKGVTDDVDSTLPRLASLAPSVDANGTAASSGSSQRGSQKTPLPTSENLSASSAPTSCYMLRNRGAKQNKLVYDLKYHPMDDSIRPTQAAKRRSAHGERLLSSDDSSECLSVHCDADTPPLSEASFEGEAFLEKRGWKQAKQGKKRSRDQMQSPQEPTRRSSRRVSDEKKSYDMSVHPQDEDLELLSSDDEELSMPSPKRKRTHSRKSGNSSAATSIAPKTKAGRAKRIVISSDAESGTMDQEGIFTGGDSLDGIFQMSPEEVAHADDTQVKPTSSTSSICTPPPHGIRRKESLDVWKLFPGDRYFRHERDSLPFTQGQSFEIWEEQTEDQAVKEALAAFPLDFEHDDKENEIEGADQQNSDPLEGISVLPASQSRRSDGDALDAQNPRLVHGALYEEEVIALDNYGLHSTDGANDEDAADQLDTNLEIMRLLASGGDLPRETSKNDPSESIP